MKLQSILVGTALVFGSALGLSAIHGGTPPTARHSASMHGTGNILIDKLREATNAAPDDLPSWKALANALGDELKKLDFESPELSLEMVDVLSNVLRLEPSDPQALITLANLAFNQKAFNKSAELYERYLASQPNDLLARASLGSSYTFLKRSEDAERELLTVLKADPNQFQGLAYISILYAERGDKTKAIQFGERALKAAPVEEAKLRFTVFLDKLKGGAVSSALSPKPPLTTAVSFDEYVKSHPILGPKLIKIITNKQERVVELRSFPIAAMPPMAKDKLRRDMLPLVPEGTSVKLVDIDNNQTLELR